MFKNEYFTNDELKCKCCGENKINDTFLSALIEIRKAAGIPFIVNSGYRCEKHNRAIGGVVGSSHVKGLAADIRYENSTQLYAILNAIMRYQIKPRVLIYKDFVHFDMDFSKPCPIVKLMTNKE